MSPASDPIASHAPSDLAGEAALPRAVLDVDYNARASVAPATFEASMQRYRTMSDACRRDWLERAELVYDTDSGQTLDVFGDRSATRRPVFVFVHGGYWRALSKDDSSFMAGTLARSGIATAAVDYRLAPDASIGEIVREVRAACAYLWRNADSLGIDPDRIFVGGSSAGAHLAATVLSGGWHAGAGVPPDIVKGALLVSGLFHLGPIAKCFAQEWARLDDHAVAELSPALNPPATPCPVAVAYASGEPAGFVRQSLGYAALLRSRGNPVDVLEVPDRNHFDVILDLADAGSHLTRSLLALVDRSGA